MRGRGKTQMCGNGLLYRGDVHVTVGLRHDQVEIMDLSGGVDTHRLGCKPNLYHLLTDIREKQTSSSRQSGSRFLWSIPSLLQDTG